MSLIFVTDIPIEVIGWPSPNNYPVGTWAYHSNSVKQWAVVAINIYNLEQEPDHIWKYVNDFHSNPPPKRHQLTLLVYSHA